MSDFKSVKQLCEENPNLNNHILSLSDVITELEHKNKELENSVIEARKYYKELDKFASTVYAPDKSTYKELEDKLKNFEVDKNREIDELWATKIKPLREKVEQYEKSLELSQSITVNDGMRIKELQGIISKTGIQYPKQILVDFKCGTIILYKNL